jgi:hypothetical protein
MVLMYIPDDFTLIGGYWFVLFVLSMSIRDMAIPFWVFEANAFRGDDYDFTCIGFVVIHFFVVDIVKIRSGLNDIAFEHITFFPGLKGEILKNGIIVALQGSLIKIEERIKALAFRVSETFVERIPKSKFTFPHTTWLLF